MVYAGTQTTQMIGGNSALYVVTADLDADTEEGAALDMENFGFIPFRVNMLVTRTAGSTAGIAVSVEGSVDGTTYTSLADVTAKDTEAVDDTVSAYRYFKCVCTTVGSGNTLTCRWILSRI